MRIILLLFGLAVTALAQDAQLAALRGTVLDLRASRSDGANVPYATLAKAKHQLRDWIETDLAKFPQNGDETALTARLNSRLDAAHLTCEPRQKIEDKGDTFCPEDGNLQGYVNQISAERESGYLVITTSMGIVGCDWDESAYIYSRVGPSWHRVLDTEENGTSKSYDPELIKSVKISRPGKDGSRLVLVLGLNFGCESVWHPIHYQIWRLGGSQALPKLLLKTSELAVTVGGPLEGRVQTEDILIEFESINGSIDVAFRHISIRHFLIQGDGVHEVGPYALTPLGFLVEWTDNATVRAVANPPSPLVESWRKALSNTWSGPAKRCREDRELWQIQLNRQGDARSVYALVRWRMPYDFTITSVNEMSRPHCTLEDTSAKEERSPLEQTN